ncbi:hypothetical protein [Pseudomonas jessenii]|uniref:hypothetical protein n=1 Tax=Pseudomonas jessenii TaxID=77298 RepID=UPI0011C06F16|nr:hypothetical protein [Pseudomonas jessenii]
MSLDRGTVERALALLESHPDIAQGGPSLCQEVCAFRQAMAEPKVELWAMHSVGPGEVYACLSKEEAEQAAQSLRDAGVKWKESKVARGENVEFWTEWVSEVIPSPWEPAEHFEILAEQEKDEAERLRVLATSLTEEKENLRKALAGMLFAFDDGVGLDWSADLLDYARKLCPAEEFKP